MKGVVFSLLGLILLMCACGSSKTKQECGKATVQADTVKSYQGELSIIYPGKIKAASEVSCHFGWLDLFGLCCRKWGLS